MREPGSSSAKRTAEDQTWEWRQVEGAGYLLEALLDRDPTSWKGAPRGRTRRLDTLAPPAKGPQPRDWAIVSQ